MLLRCIFSCPAEEGKWRVLLEGKLREVTLMKDACSHKHTAFAKQAAVRQLPANYHLRLQH